MNFFAVDLDGDLLAVIGPAPDWSGHVALEDHVVGEEGREADVGDGGRGQGDGES